MHLRESVSLPSAKFPATAPIEVALSVERHRLEKIAVEVTYVAARVVDETLLRSSFPLVCLPCRPEPHKRFQTLH